MKIIQELTIDDTTYIFTNNPVSDIKPIIELYKQEERIEYLGYETPELHEFNFLGENHTCITFWHDNEDPKKIELSNLITKDK